MLAKIKSLLRSLLNPGNKSTVKRISLPYFVSIVLLVLLSGSAVLLWRALKEFNRFSTVSVLILICAFLLIAVVFSLLRADDKTRLKLNEFADEIQESKEELAELLQTEKILREEAELLSRDKDKFISLVSHQIRTPLNAISGWIRVVENPNSSDEIKVQAYKRIDENIKLQATALDDLVMLSELTSGKIPMNPDTVVYADLVKNVLDEACALAKREQIEILRATTLTKEEVQCDELIVGRALYKLLESAVKQTPRGGTIKTTASADSDYITLEISDGGKSIEKNGTAFNGAENEYSVTASEFGELALGISVSRQLINLCGGEIESPGMPLNSRLNWIVKLPRTA